MRRLVLVALALLAFGFRETPPPRAFVLANEPIVFDGIHPRFTDRQLHASAAATRAGLARWAATASGRRLVERFNTEEFHVTVIEDRAEDGAGRAPQPGLATLIAAADHAKVKDYELILNPTFGENRGFDRVPGAPLTTADMMAVAWAAEMLHIDYYSQGISLPHHERPDFQEKWHAVAAELGFPSLPHDGRNEPGTTARVIYW